MILTRRREDAGECLGYHNVRTQHINIPFYQIGPGYASKPVSLLFAPPFGGKGVYEKVPNIGSFGFEVLSQGW